MAATSLNAEQVDKLRKDGYVVVRNAVSPALCDRAVRAINVNLGKGILKEEAENIANGICFPALMMQPVITDLFNRSAVGPIVRSAVGPIQPVFSGQIALRFPGAMCIDQDYFQPLPMWKQYWHIDGLTDAQERWAKKGTISNFTCLVGVALRDVPAPLHGNLCVHPGSHIQLQDYFKQNPKALTDLANRGDEALPRKLPFREMEQVCMKAGDLVIAHYQLAHSVAPNCSPDIRYVIYFRAFSTAHNGYRPEAMRDVWLDWAGLRGGFKPADPTADAALAASVNEQLVLAESFPSKLPYDGDRVAVLRPKADTLFEENKFAEALPLYRELADRMGDDFVANVKTALCFVILAATTPADAPRIAAEAEEYAARAAAILPTFPGSHGLLARFQAVRGNNEGAIKSAEAMIACPPIQKGYEWARDLVGEGMKGAAIACIASKQPAARMQDLRERAVKKFPDFAAKIEESVAEGESEPLWTAGRALMEAEPKDWKRLQEIFGRLSQLHPTNFWARLHAGAAFTYGAVGNQPGLRVGESHLRATIDIDPVDPSAYGILARNLVWQGKMDQVPPLVDVIISCAFKGHAIPFILDGLRCGREAMLKKGQPQEMAGPLFARARAAFPQIAADIERVSAEKAGCVIF